MTEKINLETKIKDYEGLLKKISELQKRSERQEAEAKIKEANLCDELSSALAANAFGETDHPDLESLRNEIRKTRRTIEETPLLIQGLEAKAVRVRVELNRAVRDLRQIKNQELYDESKEKIQNFANRGIFFKNAESDFRQAAEAIGKQGEANTFIREMTKIFESKSMQQASN